MKFTIKVLLFSLTILITGCNSSSEQISNSKKDSREEIEPTQTANININQNQVQDIIEQNLTQRGATEESEDINLIEENEIGEEQGEDNSGVSTQYTQNNIELYPTPQVSNRNISPTPNPTPTNQPYQNQNIKVSFLNSCDQIVDKEFFEVCYSYDLKVAKAVIYRLEGDLVNELNIKERPDFYEEEQIPKEYRAEYSDYTNSGYDRGHLAPDASFDWSIESLEATYSLANIIPQVPQVNRYGWANLEQYVRDQAVELGYIDVINVVEYKDSPERIGENQIAVSSGYYKILLNEDENYKECFYYKNQNSTQDESIDKHRVDCNSIR